MVIQIYPVLLLPWSGKETESARVKYREIIADRLSKAGWSWGYVSGPIGAVVGGVDRVGIDRPVGSGWPLWKRLAEVGVERLSV